MIRLRFSNLNVNISFLYIALITLLSLFDKTSVLFLGVISSFLHELSHILAIYLVGAKPNSITFLVSGIKINQPKHLTPFKQAIVLIAGPLGNIILFLVSIYYGHLTFATVNLCLAVFNLLPTRVLDGGGLLYLLFYNIFSKKVGFIIYKIISITFSSLLILIGIKIIVEYKNPTILLTAMFLFVSAISCKD